MHVCKQAAVVISLPIMSRGERGESAANQYESAIDELASLMRSHCMAWTWIVDDLATGARIAKASRDGGTCEIAMAWDETWCATSVARGAFATELGRRLSQACERGLEISTLALSSEAQVPHRDLLTKQGITAITSTEQAMTDGSRIPWIGRLLRETNACLAFRPHALCWGLWSMPPSFDLLSTTRRSLSQRLETCVANASVLHARIDVDKLAGAPKRAIARLDDALTTIETHCERGVLESRTMASAAAHLTRPHAGTRARSILRHAA